MQKDYRLTNLNNDGEEKKTREEYREDVAKAIETKYDHKQELSDALQIIKDSK